MKTIIFFIISTIIFTACKNHSEKVSFLPVENVTSDGIFDSSNIMFSDTISKKINLGMLYAPNIVGRTMYFDFDKLPDTKATVTYIGSTENMKNRPPYLYISTKVVKFSYKNSYIYVKLPFDAGVLRKYNIIVTGIIKDPEIIMKNGIEIGMDKDSVLKKMFDKSFLNEYKDILYYADTLVVYDHFSIMENQIIFKDNKLYSYEMYHSWDESEY